MCKFTYGWQAFWLFQMQSADLHEVRWHGPGDFGSEVAVDEHRGRADGRQDVVRSWRFGALQRPLGIPYDEHAVRQQYGVAEPLDERPGHRVAGHHVGHDGRVRDVSQERASW